MIPSTTDTQPIENTYQVCDNHTRNFDKFLKAAAQKQNYDDAIEWIELGANPKVIGAYNPTFDRNLLDKITQLFLEKKDLLHASLSAQAIYDPIDLRYNRGDVRGKAMYNVCVELLENGEIDAAIHIAQEIRPKLHHEDSHYYLNEYRDNALNKIVEHLLKLNQVDRAIEVADIWMSKIGKKRALLQIIHSQLENKRVEHVVELAKKIPCEKYSDSRDQELSKISTKLAGNGEIDAAIEIAKQIRKKNRQGFGRTKMPCSDCDCRASSSDERIRTRD